MPVYQYACTECGDALEVRQSFTDDALTVCSHCGGRLRKVLSAVGVVFKGSGFYRNDSRAAAASAKESSNGTKAESGDSSSSGDKGSSSTESSSTSGDKSSTSSSDSSKASGGKSSGDSSSSSPAKTATS